MKKRALDTVVFTMEEHMLEKNLSPVCPPGMLLRTKQSSAATWMMAVMEVNMVDCKLRAKYRVAKREAKYTVVNTILSEENRLGKHGSDWAEENQEEDEVREVPPASSSTRFSPPVAPFLENHDDNFGMLVILGREVAIFRNILSLKRERDSTWNHELVVLKKRAIFHAPKSGLGLTRLNGLSVRHLEEGRRAPRWRCPFHPR
ncbi:hypothetical protein E2C01_022614 [Portunus trituberculatus]|uniref:Uncharacterized protein n=1 Tax=Portunus trituberculatus TaxID=210409 RepID=A0A5B7E7S4_PORTR|nr:hypothetical protein [Portunus trituberculatus]